MSRGRYFCFVAKKDSHRDSNGLDSPNPFFRECGPLSSAGDPIQSGEGEALGVMTDGQIVEPGI
jgi:hypothetical protein